MGCLSDSIMDRLIDLVNRAGCGCRACTERRQPGHFACSVPPEALVKLEERGIARRVFYKNTWYWDVDYRLLTTREKKALIAELE